MIYGWSPGIGDPDLLGWMTVAAYLVAAALCGRAARRQPSMRGFWLFLVLLLVALGINKQLDLQSLLTAVGRHLARSQGWYASRRAVQLAFIVAAATVGLAAAVWLAWYLRDRGRSARLAGLGCAMLLAFVLIRAASFEQVDAVLASNLSGVRINHLLELGGIAVVGIAALMRGDPARSGVKPGSPRACIARNVGE